MIDRKNTDVYAQIYVYDRKPVLDKFLKRLIALCGDEGEWVLTGISMLGRKRFAKIKSLTKVFEKLRATFPDGINEFEIVGQKADELDRNGFSKVTINCALSPLNKDWGAMGEVDTDRYTRPVVRELWSLRSKEGFVFHNGFKRYPVTLEIQFSYGEESAPVSRKVLIDLFAKMIQAWSGEYSKNYIGYIDAKPFPMSSAMALIGGNLFKSTRMDATLDQPHIVVFGPPKVIDRYASDVLKACPKIDMITETIGAANLVAFKDWQETSKLHLPKWHEYEPDRDFDVT